MNNNNKEIVNGLLVVKDLYGNVYRLYKVDVCCGKALLIGEKDNKFYVRALTDLSVL